MTSTQSTDWHKSASLYEAAEGFHTKHARQPKMRHARQIHTQYTEEIRKALAAEKTCHRIEYAGSSYEMVKVAKSPTDPDLEFDIMVIFRGGKELVATPIHGRPGFATLSRKPDSTALAAMTRNKDGEGNILPKETNQEFVSKLQKIINASPNMNGNVKLINHGPAVQMNVYEGGVKGGRKLYSVDFVPTYEVDGAMYVAKPVPGAAPMAANAWRRSYSLDEKKIFDAIDWPNNGCRKKVLRVLKAIRNREPGLAHLTSFLLKTALFKELEEQSSWRCKQLGERLMDVLGRLEDDLSKGFMAHKFISGVNLLDGLSQEHIQNMHDRIKHYRSSEIAFMKVMNS